ncbi:MAG TPA: sugar phosphate isomerase/epimerase [Candidatus Limnocylindrales bacterium]|nr:sugar phosphate isomerase/epimerase [Candidatus Limnocylindrales bacterium]
MAEPNDLAIQLYTVRRFLADDLDGTLATLAEIGFRQVEAFDLPTYGERLAAALPRHRLTVPSVHAGLLDDLDGALDRGAAVGAALVIQPWTEPARWETTDGIRRIADGLNGAARAAADRGLRVGYHNHHFELASVIGGRHALEVFADELDPAVVLEVDAYWAHAGGADVPALVRRLGDRVAALHLKDGDGSLDTSRQVAAGDGVVPLREVVAAAPGALRIVELDDTAGDMWEAVRRSRAFLLAAERADA